MNPTTYRLHPPGITLDRPHALLSGSFNPLHRGHVELADRAAHHLAMPVAFEISIANVDKPPLPEDEVARRLAQFTGPVLVTAAPRFVDKALLFPETVFVVGADTAVRIVEPRYYGNGSAMGEALATIRDRGCRFLVAGRVDAAGNYVAGDEVPIPREWSALFEAIAFRMDVSSSEIRKDVGPPRRKERQEDTN